MSDRGTGLLLVMIDIDPAYEEDFNRWYEEEHLPERLGCPGFLSGRRFVSVEGEPKYLALYELNDPEVLETEAYKAMQPPTGWTKRVSPHFTSFVRNVYREIPRGTS
jgi:hypothetical protein